MKDNIKRIYICFFSFFLIYLVYKMSTLLLKLGLYSAATEIFYIIVSLYLGYSLIRYMQYRKSYSFDELELYNRVNKIFSKIEGKITPLQGVTLKKDEVKGELDSIIVTSKGVFNVVSCSYIGDIKIKEDGNWYKRDRKGYYMISSPINKIKKNREILSKIYDEEEIVDVVLLLSDYIEIEGEENFSVPIVKNDEINDYIDDYEIEDEYDESVLYDKLYVTIDSEKDLDGIKASYKKYIDAKLQFRSRLAAVSIFAILYILNIIYK